MAISVRSIAGGGDSAPTARWVHTWTAMPQWTEPDNLPPAPFTQDSRVFANTTLRQTIRVSIGGSRLRIRLSNVFGGAALPVTAVSIAFPLNGRAGVSAIAPGSSRAVTFSGRTSVVIPVGAQLVSDPLDIALAPGSNLSVSLYLADGQASTTITSHPGSRTTSYLLTGDHVADLDMPSATPVEHWYLLGGVEVLASASGSAAAVLLGDSLTDGRGSTTDGNDRWPDRLLDRLRTSPETAAVAVLNQAAGGNRILNHGNGPNALSRLDRDVFAYSGVRWLVVFEGINDIGTADPSEAARKQVTDDLITAYDQIITRAHAHGIRVYGATLLPFGHCDYDDRAGTREASRQAVNHWIRTSGRFDEVIDFEQVVRDPENPRHLLANYDCGDHLHLSPTGYRALGDAVPVDLFR